MKKLFDTHTAFNVVAMLILTALPIWGAGGAERDESSRTDRPSAAEPASSRTPEPARTEYTKPDELAALIRSDRKHYLIDVRTEAEYESGHIPTALNIPYDEIADRLPTGDRDALIVLYCRSGNRSGTAERTLRSLGFTNVVNFGGISRWRGGLE